jgi:hypothetical protein
VKSIVKSKKGKNLYPVFRVQISLKQAIALSAFLSNFSLEYSSTKVQGNKVRIELNDTYQCLFCGVDVNLLDKNKYHREILMNCSNY